MKRLTAIALLISLSACIIIEDYGSEWENAPFDPCIAELAGKVSELDLPEKPDTQFVRWMKLDDTFNLMLLKEAAENKGGHGHLYTIDSNVITFYTPNKTTRKRFERDIENPPVRFDEDTVIIDTLNAETLSFITQIAHKGEYWQIKESALYNIRRNEACNQYEFPEDDE